MLKTFLFLAASKYKPIERISSSYWLRLMLNTNVRINDIGVDGRHVDGRLTTTSDESKKMP